MSLAATLRDPEFRAGWRLLLASVLGIGYGLTAMGVTYSLGAFVKPVSEALGGSRQQVLNVSVFVTLAVIPASLIAGTIIDRIGSRRLTLASIVAFAATFVGLGLLTRDFRSLYFGYTLLPLLGIATTPLAYARAIAAQFERHRGLALGIALSGTGLCALTVPPYLASVIGRWGWRAGYVALAVPPLLFALPTAWAWLRDADVDVDAATGAARVVAARAGLESGAAFRSRRFWTMAVAFFAVSMAATGLLTNAVPLLVDRGYTPMRAAGALGGFGIAVVVGRVLVGLLVDRAWAPAVGAAILLPAAGLLLTMLAPAIPWPVALAVLVVTGLATGAELDLCAYLTARYFGLRAYGRIYGALFIAFAVGAGAVGPVFGGLYEHFRSYGPVLVAASVGYALCALLLLTLGRYPVFADDEAATH